MSLATHATRTAIEAAALGGRHAHTVTGLAHLLAQRLPSAQRVLNAELGNFDGYPAQASGSDQGGRGKGGVSRPTERLALARLGIHDRKPDDGPAIDVADLYETVMGARDAVHRATLERDRTDRDDWLIVAVKLLRQAHGICDRHTPPGDPNAARNMRCAGTGDEHGATCEQIADYRIGDGGVVLPTADRRCVDCRATVAQRELDEAAAREAQRRRKHARTARMAR
jgi:hypothetical protein